MNKDIPIFKKFTWVAMENCTKYSLNYSEKFISPVFWVPIGENITKWHLELSKSCGSTWSLYLFRNDKIPLKFSVKFSLFIVGKSKKYLEKSFRQTSENFKRSETKGSGHSQFFTSSTIYQLFDQIVPDRKFTIGCEIVILTKKATDKLQLMPSLCTHIQRMFEKQLFTDFEFRCTDGVSVKCHRSVLAARSPVFEAMLSNDMEETRQGFSDVPEYDSTLMKEFLRFIYCGFVLNIHDFAKDLIFLADKYDLEDLKELCINSCIKDLSKENVVENLQIVDKVSGCIRLFEECVGLIGGDFTENSKIECWKELSNDMLKKLAILEDTKAECVD